MEIVLHHQKLHHHRLVFPLRPLRLKTRAQQQTDLNWSKEQRTVKIKKQMIRVRLQERIIDTYLYISPFLHMFVMIQQFVYKIFHAMQCEMISSLKLKTLLYYAANCDLSLFRPTTNGHYSDLARFGLSHRSTRPVVSTRVTHTSAPLTLTSR